VSLQFDMMDTERCGGTLWDSTTVKNSTTNEIVEGPVGGHGRGPFKTGWLPVPANAGLKVEFSSDYSNCAVTSTGACDCSRSDFGFSGVAMRAYEYRRYEGASGARPMWTPLRFPGQYHDAETDLFENWNRYYDPTGLYTKDTTNCPDLPSEAELRKVAMGLVDKDEDGLMCSLRSCVLEKIKNAHLTCEPSSCKPEELANSPKGFSCASSENMTNWCKKAQPIVPG
jgi:hypothetical protein